jgi:hypothetical protein
MGLTNFDQINLQAETTLHFFIAGAQTTGTKKAQALVSRAGVITGVRAYLDTPPTGAAFIIDCNINGVTAYTTQTNRPTVAISGNASTTTAPDVTTVAAGDRISVDVDQIGSSVAGSDLSISITIKRALV